MENEEMTIEEARKKVGLSRREVSEWLEIPYRTLTSWELGERPCPRYMEKLIVEKILRGKEKVKSMMVYELKKFTAEIKKSEISGKEELTPGCTIERDTDPETIKKFDNLEDAEAELEKMPKATARYMRNVVPFWAVEEYAIEAYEANEDGDFLIGSDYYTQDDMEIVE